MFKPKIFVDSVSTLESTLHSLIPISRHMGITVDAYDGQSLTLTAPLANNINHQESAFGGSLFSVAVLAGWGLMQLKLNELALDCNTVVAGGETVYLRPVFGELICTATLPADSAEFFDRLNRNGRASTNMVSSFLTKRDLGKPAMTLNGKYHLTRRDHLPDNLQERDESTK